MSLMPITLDTMRLPCRWRVFRCALIWLSFRHDIDLLRAMPLPAMSPPPFITRHTLLLCLMPPCCLRFYDAVDAFALPLLMPRLFIIAADAFLISLMPF